MRHVSWKAAAGSVALATALAGGLALAQEAPESLLPPGFDDPAPAPTPTAQPIRPEPVLPGPTPIGPAPAQPSPAEPALPGAAPPLEPSILDNPDLPPLPEISEEELAALPTLEELEELSTDELDDLLGLTPKFDIPPAARRSMRQVGIIDPDEGGFPIASLGRQPGSIVQATLSGTKGPLVSRWGHILLRRVLASRLTAPQSMSPVEFAALRASVLNAIGEYSAARAIVQDIDTGNWNEQLTQEAITAYVAQADMLGACPAVRLRRSTRDDSEWLLLSAICNAYAGDTSLANAQLVNLVDEEVAPEIDIRLTQRFAGAAGFGRRGVSIEWDGVTSITPWRFALANAVGEPIPEELLGDLEPYYARSGATAPMLSLADRAAYADRAGSEGILSAQAMVQLYSQIYANNTIQGEAANNAIWLREAYVAPDPADRIAAMRSLWEQSQEAGTQGAYVATAFAAARLAPSASHADNAAELIASMLTAGLDRDAETWVPFVEAGSQAWALIALARQSNDSVNLGEVDEFLDDDGSDEQRKSQFLVAGLAGLGRIANADRDGLAGRLELGLGRETNWTRMISAAAEARNPALVAMLVGLGMQGSDWSQMTPLHLFHITSALRSVGLGAEARMIAAEAVARG